MKILHMKFRPQKLVERRPASKVKQPSQVGHARSNPTSMKCYDIHIEKHNIERCRKAMECGEIMTSPPPHPQSNVYGSEFYSNEFGANRGAIALGFAVWLTVTLEPDKPTMCKN